MEIDVSLVRFVGGPFKGRPGTVAHHGDEDMRLYNPDGEILVDWTAFYIIEREKSNPANNYVPCPHVKTLNEHPAEWVGDGEFSVHELALIAKVAFQVVVESGGWVSCLGNNICARFDVLRGDLY